VSSDIHDDEKNSERGAVESLINSELVEPKRQLRTTRSETLFKQQQTPSQKIKQPSRNTTFQFSVASNQTSPSKTLNIIILSSDEQHIQRMKQMSEKLGHRCIVTDSIQQCKELIDSTPNGVLFFVSE
jgi:hypothetical protein